MSKPPILRTEQVCKRFGGVNAVDGIDFSVAEGELRCIIGPNGAGKSTFFKMLSGQLQPTAGRILFREVDITREERHRIARRGVAIKTQVPNVFDGLSAFENLRIAAARRLDSRGAAELARDILARVEMTAHADRAVGELAHGQRQWIEIGMLLAVDPALVLLDEPTAGMTKEEVARAAAMIRALANQRAVIVVEHDMKFVRMVDANVTVFHQGRILVEGPTDTVLRDTRVRDVYLGKAAH
ncbi:MAG: ATP-binding cassette domain-containing protein [Betaproteobacteria bacterium]|nr:ATP-binding cassette domain-containing protein [Betaproteobacteria bacterium]